MPERCDNQECVFYTQPLIWNGKALRLILDHIDGNRFDNSPDMLRLLCPNCNQQLHTHGGGNKGRLESKTETGYTIKERDGQRKHAIIPPPDTLLVTGHPPRVSVAAPGKKSRPG